MNLKSEAAALQRSDSSPGGAIFTGIPSWAFKEVSNLGHRGEVFILAGDGSSDGRRQDGRGGLARRIDSPARW